MNDEDYSITISCEIIHQRIKERKELHQLKNLSGIHKQQPEPHPDMGFNCKNIVNELKGVEWQENDPTSNIGGEGLKFLKKKKVCINDYGNACSGRVRQGSVHQKYLEKNLICF